MTGPGVMTGPFPPEVLFCEWEQKETAEEWKRAQRANAEQTVQFMKKEAEWKIRKGRIYEKDKGRKGEKKKSEHRTLVARAPRGWWLYHLDTEFLQ